MNESETTAKRVRCERERLGLTIAQFAVLLGISEAKQQSIEEGNLADCPTSYGDALKRAGGDPLFVFGHAEQPNVQRVDLLIGDDGFLRALELLRKSQQAIDAFLGEGTSSKAPELVAALISATMHERMDVGAGNWEDFFQKIAVAIEYAGERIAESLAPDSDS